MQSDPRRTQLMDMTEEEAAKLPLDDWYARIRFLRQDIGARALNGRIPMPTYQDSKKTLPRSPVKASVVFKDWVKD